MTSPAVPAAWRNVAILGAAQALAASGGPLVTLAGGIVGQSLASSPLLATLPISLLVVGIAAGTLPVSIVTRRIGRRATFMACAAISAAGALLAARATAVLSFPMFCAATFVMGAAGASVQQYRFAAAESVDVRHTGRAVSFVLVGGIIAGALGPEIGRRGRGWLGSEFSGAFVLVAIVQLIALMLLMGLRMPATPIAAAAADRPPIGAFFRRPSFTLAVVGAASAAAIMSFLMTATPVSMHVHDRHSIDDAAFVIQSHVVAMFAPSLVTGVLVDRLGPSRMMTAGALAIGGAVAAGASGHTVAAYWAGLVLLGFGWNLLFIGSTVQLAQSLAPEERVRAQGLNDLTVFGTQALASLAAGAVLHRFGWIAMNLTTVPLLIVVLVLIARHARRPAPASTA